MRGCACGDRDGVSSPELGVAHVSCLAEQAKILVAEAVKNNLGAKEEDARWCRWNTCSLCEQSYHGVVECALGWACWETYLGQPEEHWTRGMTMTLLENGLSDAKHYEDALIVREARLSLARRLGASEHVILVAQSNIAGTYQSLGWLQEALRVRQDVHYGTLKLLGEEHIDTLRAASNYVLSLLNLRRNAGRRRACRPRRGRVGGPLRWRLRRKSGCLGGRQGGRGRR